MFERIPTYLKEVRAEFARVVWPTRSQAISMTLSVIVMSLIVAAFVGGLDYLFTRLLEYSVLKK